MLPIHADGCLLLNGVGLGLAGIVVIFRWTGRMIGLFQLPLEGETSERANTSQS